MSAKPPPILKSIREKDSREKMSREWFHRVFVCTFNFYYLLFYSCVSNQWAMNCCIYVQRLMRYRIFVWSSQLILWPLFRLLLFVINERNKCVMFSLSQWWSLLSDDDKFLTHHYRNSKLQYFSHYKFKYYRFLGKEKD